MIASELLTLNTSNVGSTLIAAEPERARDLEVELRDAFDERGARRLEIEGQRRLAEDAVGMMISPAGQGDGQLAG